MNKGDKRLTKKEIEKIRNLYQKGLSFKEIGERFRCDRTTIGYWVKNYRKNEIKKPRGYPIIIQEEEKDDDEYIDNGRCIVCKEKRTDPKWKLTRYCSFSCWWGNYLRNHPPKKTKEFVFFAD